MARMFRAAASTVALMTLLLGVLAPLAMTAIAQLALPGRANGSLIVLDGRIIGSRLIGQDFTAPGYFHPRPSATTEPDPDKPGATRPHPYNAANSGASQLGPTSAALLAAVKGRIAGPTPADAATASASGLDPHISPANALQQLPRIAAARAQPAEAIARLVAGHTSAGLLGQPVVNVLELNLALDGK